MSQNDMRINFVQDAFVGVKAPDKNIKQTRTECSAIETEILVTEQRNNYLRFFGIDKRLTK